jgi:FkbM family methyltransferase
MGTGSVILKKLIKETLLSMGVTVKRYSIFNDHYALLARYLDRFAVDLLVDVGAYDGGFARAVRARGYTGRIVSLEPLSTLYGTLAIAAGGDPLWDVVCCALGDQEGKAIINVAGNAASSSLRDMMPVHGDAAPHAAFVARETVNVRRLDTLLDELSPAGGKIFVKSDTQGFEREVVAGASGALDRIIGFQLEMSTVPLYSGESLMGDLICELGRLGYSLVHVEPSFRNPENGNLLQADGMFFRLGY